MYNEIRGKKMIKTLIVSGGNIDIDFLKEIINDNKYNYIIASDKGLEALDSLNIKPRYLIGDFDSLNKKILNKYINNSEIEIIELNPIKDYTDTHMALKKAIEIKSTDITVIGAIGTRFDHTIANINVLKEALNKNIKCKILDKHNEISLINKSIKLKKDKNYPFISLIPLTTKVEGITLKGFKYNLSNATMSIGKSLGVSNEQMKSIASIEIKKGIVILIKSKD